MDKLPQRLLLVPLHLRHGLNIKPRQRRKEEGKETIIRDASRMCKMYKLSRCFYSKSRRSIQRIYRESIFFSFSTKR